MNRTLCLQCPSLCKDGHCKTMQKIIRERRYKAEATQICRITNSTRLQFPSCMAVKAGLSKRRKKERKKCAFESW